MKKWILHMKKADFVGLSKTLKVDPVVVKIMRNRGLESEDEYTRFLSGGWEQLYEPDCMKGIVQAADLIKQKIEQKKSIRIIGDYDIDGINATYILYKGLCRAGADVDTAIPDRILDGYGINESLILQAHEDGKDTIITCDNGIAAAAQIAYAKGLGMTVVVTDHHDIPYEEEEGGARQSILPPADVVVDPKQEGCPYPLKEICGAVVALKFIQVLYRQFGIEQNEAQEFLQFAAMATVGDVMPLKDENRILVKLGLQQLHTAPCIGLEALMRACKLEKETVKSYHIGFVLGPCLNASGRLETAQHALKLLLAENEQTADTLALKLKALNDERKAMTQEGVKDAVAQIEQSKIKEDKVLVVYLPQCHESLAGIIAGRIKERYYKPVLVFTDAEPQKDIEEGSAALVKGSGRSIEAYHMYDELTKCKDLFTKYGGHPMAAGVSMPKEHLEALRDRLNKNQTLTEGDLTEKLYIDAAMPFSYITEAFVENLNVLEPFGNGNEKPVFAVKSINILHIQQVGREHKILKMTVSDGTCEMDAVYFGDIETFERLICDTFGEQQLMCLYGYRKCNVTLLALYYPTVNEYMGNKKLQITIREFSV